MNLQDQEKPINHMSLPDQVNHQTNSDCLETKEIISTSSTKQDSSCEPEEGQENNNEESQCDDMRSLIQDENRSNLSIVSPILTCIQTLNESELIWDEERDKFLQVLSLKKLGSEKLISEKDGFCFVVSLRDGCCLYSSSAITTHLGYPKDMLESQCILNFLFPKDHITFTNHLTQGLNACFIQGKKDNSHLVPNTFFCRLRVYQGLRYGFSVANRKPMYKPFKITLYINELILDDVCVEKQAGTLCVKATAADVQSGYSIPQEIPAMTSFSTRHTATCHYSHIDASAIPYLGYLPQDMIGYSVFNFYHPDDILQLKEIYELIMKEHGTSFCSKPYRFKIQNGCYIMLETEWSSFINPWSHKLEFVVGQHRIIEGPSDISIFNPYEVQEVLSEEKIKENENLQNEIVGILTQPVEDFNEKKTKKIGGKRKRDLAAFVYSCIDEGFKSFKHKENDNKIELTEEGNNSDPESVVMGNISPFREVPDSSISSENSPTDQQMQFQENIERYFASNPYVKPEEEYKNEKLSSIEDFRSGSAESEKQSSSNAESEKQSFLNAGSEKRSSSNAESSLNNHSKKQQSSSSQTCDSKMQENSSSKDSGYGKSFENESKSMPGPSYKTQTSSKNTTISEKLSPSMTLTEKSLLNHNRINHKQLKLCHRKIKSAFGPPFVNTTSAPWPHKKEVKHVKHKKALHVVTSIAKMNASDAEKTINVESKFRPIDPPKMEAMQKKNLENMTSVTNSCGVNQNAYFNNPQMPPTPFFIPVVYMGNMPYYPPTSAPSTTTQANPNELPAWPTLPGASGGFPFPQPFPHGFPLFHPFFGGPISPHGVSSSGVTTTSTVTKATTTVASGLVDTIKTPVPLSSLKTTPPPRKNIALSDSNESDMQVDDTFSSSFFTQSSENQFSCKNEESEVETNRSFAGLMSKKISLTSDIAFRYQMKPISMEDILRKDSEFLKSTHQSRLVDEQLEMLQTEMQVENGKIAKTETNLQVKEDVLLGLTTEDETVE